MAAQDTCPYCGRDLESCGGATDEHIFVEALGGKAILPAGRNCNSTIGHSIEGQLLKQGTLLHFIRQVHQGTGQPLRGELEGGTVIENSLGGADVYFRRPFSQVREENSTTYRITGGTEQARRELEKLAKHLKLSPEETQALWSKREVRSLGGQTLQVGLAYDVALVRRLAAKVGLSAGWAAFGDRFAESELASRLRDFLWGDGDMEAPSCSGEILTVFDEQVIADKLVKQGVAGISPIQASDGVSQVAFVPIRQGVAVIVTLGDWELSFGATTAPLIEAPLPVGGRLPVVIRDGLP
ncbi:hypothetical protein GHK86_03980, partial [Acidimicrobiaceae bacterium USS-CC1]|nr:hypothetical protein [Acidiferrimicrobium australe]